MIGQTISHYEITEELGRGGMGVVYKATDTELNRTVALKFLPTHVISSEKDRERFRREAQAAAALSHPNIATVYAIEESENESFIAMEFVDGQTLQEVIAESPMKIDRALEVATQIAHGLQVAHEAGVVHRDIKPSNVMLTSRGHVKIMDFGLAKISAASLLTQTGSTLGTAGYMSPEQARGDEVDRRSDVWGLGVVLYEMITGSLPFGGEYEQALVYSILNADPEPLTARRSGIPIALDGVIAKALAKDPDMRYQHVDEIPADLKAVQAGVSSMTSRIGPAVSGVQQMSGVSGLAAPEPVAHAVSNPQKRSITTLLPWILVSVATAAALFFAISVGDSVNVEPVRRLTIPLNPALGGFNNGAISIAADGRAVSFETPGPDGAQFYVRFLDETESKMVLQSTWVVEPSLSPDARWMSYKQGATLFRIAVDGGNPESLNDTLGGPVWTNWKSSSEIVTAGHFRGRPIEFFVFEGSRFESFPASEFAVDRSVVDHVYSVPNSDVILYTWWGEDRQPVVLARNLVTEDEFDVARGATYGRYYRDGYVLFQRGGDLHAVPFDLKSFDIGNSFPLVPGVAVFEEGQSVLYDVSQNGTLIYVPAGAGDTDGSSIVTGARIDELTEIGARTGALHDPRISPDGSKILVASRDEEIDIWLVDRNNRGATQRLTDSPFEDETPFWHPDGVHFYYVGSSGSLDDVILRSNINNASERDTLYSMQSHIHIESVSQDGRLVFFMSRETDAGVGNLYVLDTEKPFEARSLLETSFHELSGRISPDGKWFAYVSNETGTAEIYLQNYPDLSQRKILTNGGGVSPVWSEDSQSIFFVSGSRLMSIPIQDGNPGLALEISELPSSLIRSGGHTEYDVYGNGEEFIFLDSGITDGGQEMEMHAITGLSELLRQRDPAREQE